MVLLTTADEWGHNPAFAQPGGVVGRVEVEEDLAALEVLEGDRVAVLVGRRKEGASSPWSSWAMPAPLSRVASTVVPPDLNRMQKGAQQ
jgi:hypothetical protein